MNGVAGPLLLILAVLTIYFSDLVRKYLLKRRIEKWRAGRSETSDNEFYAALGLPVDKASAVDVRAMISGAVRIPAELIAPEDKIAELETVGDPSHGSILEYLVDMWSVHWPEDKPQALSVRDFVVQFGSRTDQGHGPR